MSANILTPAQQCANQCARAFTSGPYSISYGPGVVRRCDHGRIWQFRYRDINISVWSRLDWWWEPIVYARATKALKATGRPA